MTPTQREQTTGFTDILDLDLLVQPGIPVRIGGMVYRMQSPAAIGLLDQVHIQQYTRGFQQLNEKTLGELTEEKALEAEAELRLACSVIIPDLPQDVIASLRFVQMYGLIGSFLDTIGLTVREYEYMCKDCGAVNMEKVATVLVMMQREPLVKDDELQTSDT